MMPPTDGRFANIILLLILHVKGSVITWPADWSGATCSDGTGRSRAATGVPVFALERGLVQTGARGQRKLRNIGLAGNAATGKSVAARERGAIPVP